MSQIGYRTDTGNYRKANEDAVYVSNETGLYLVADGVGGHNAGDLASRTAVEVISSRCQSEIQNVYDSDSLGITLQQLLTEVNERILALAASDPARKGMATTLVLACLRGRTAYLANVGDSRAYLIRDRQISQITEDHTLVNDLVKGGFITREEALTHPERHKITRAMGAELTVEPDFHQVALYPEDVLILCTDGLYTEVSEDLMVQLADQADTMDDLARQLVDQAIRNEGKDNITVICIRI